MPRILAYVDDPTTDRISIVLLNNDTLEAWATKAGDASVRSDQLSRAIGGWEQQYGQIDRIIGSDTRSPVRGKPITRFVPDAQDKVTTRNALLARTIAAQRPVDKFPVEAADPQDEDDHCAPGLNAALTLAYGARRGRV